MGWPYQQKPPIGWPLDWDEPINQGLVGYWPMLVGSGNTVQDLSGNGNTGSLIADTHWVPGKFGSALDFDGAGDYVDCGTGLGTLLGNGITELSVSIWFRTNVTTGNDGLFYLGNFTSSQGEFGLHFEVGRLYILLDNGAFSKAITLSINEWYHVVIVFDYNADTVKSYLNGVLQAYFAGANNSYGEGTLNLSGLKTIIGAYYASTYNLDGLIDNVSIYNRTLSASEIAKLYQYPWWMFKDPAEIALLAAYTAGAPPAGIPIFRRRRAG